MSSHLWTCSCAYSSSKGCEYGVLRIESGNEGYSRTPLLAIARRGTTASLGRKKYVPCTHFFLPHSALVVQWIGR